MKIVVATVGFDEKLPLRLLLREGLDPEDIVVLVYSKFGSEIDVKRVEKAVETLRDLITRAGVRVENVVVSGMDFYGDARSVVRALVSLLDETKAGEIVAALCGGMRLVIFEAFFAVALLHRLRGVKTRIRLAREDGLYDVSISVDIFSRTPPLRSDAVLRYLSKVGEVKRSQLVDDVARETGLSESMVYRLLKELEELGLVIVEDDVVRLTLTGRLVCEVFGCG